MRLKESVRNFFNLLKDKIELHKANLGAVVQETPAIETTRPKRGQKALQAFR